MSRFRVSIHRNVGHPWTQEPGFDVMYVVASDEAAIDRAIAKAGDECWKQFTVGCGPYDEDECRAVFYKPCGKYGEWLDPW